MKQKPIDNTKPLRRQIDTTHDRGRDRNLARSSSTPNLKRCWLCQSCNLLNDSVTWHCLNCECVSFIAPIYKDTIIRGNVKQSITSVACTAGPVQIEIPSTATTKTTASAKESVVMDDTSSVKCPQCVFRQSDGQMCYHRLHARCTATNRNGADCYVRQPKYNIVTRYRGIDGHHNFHGRTNRSLSSIVDAFRSNNESAMHDAFFGERIFTINYNRPSNVREATPFTNSDIKRFTQFAAKSAVGENVVRRTNSMGNDDEPLSRFTVTTLTRGVSMRATDKTTLPRNGGVFVAVRDWSAPVAAMQGNADTDSYYEVLKNPNSVNNNVAQHTYENASAKGMAGVEETNDPPVYAVVNKANKMKNRVPTTTASVTAPVDSTKFTYIGMSPSTTNSKLSDSIYATIRRGTPTNSSMANAINNNGNVAAGANSNGNKRFSCSDVDVNDSTTHISITSSNDKSQSDTSQIYAKVWKGPKKPMDAQKMYVQSSRLPLLFQEKLITFPSPQIKSNSVK